MPGSFRDLEIWQEAHRLALEIYKATKGFPKEELFALVSQLRRASISVAANIAESCGRYGIKDKIQLMIIARGSIFETRSHLSISFDLGYIDNKTFDLIDGRYESLSKRINAFINHLRKLKPTNQLTN